MIDPLDAAFCSFNRIKELRKKAKDIGAILKLEDCWVLSNLPGNPNVFRCHNLDEIEEMLVAVKQKM